MKMFKTLLALVLCMALALPCAAVGETYVPGQTIQALFADVWNSGKMISGDLSLSFDLNAEALGLTQDDLAEVNALLALLDAATLRVGACRIDGGVRIALTGMLEAQEGAEDVEVSAAIDLTATGLSVDSSLIPGKKVTAAWETLLQMCGLSSDEIAMVMSLRDADLQALIDMALSELQSYLALAAQILAPYADTLSAWYAALPADQFENVEATEDYPAAAHVVNVYVTEKALGELVTQLTTQLEADTTLCALLNSALAEGYDGEGSAPTAAELCAELREEAAGWTDEEYPLMLTMAFDEAGTPLYAELYNALEDGSGDYAGLFFYPEAGNPNTVNYDLSIYNVTASGSVGDGFSLYGTLTADPADPADMELTFNLAGIDNGSIALGINYIVSSGSAVTAGGLPAVTTDQEMNISVNDYSLGTLQMLMSGHTQTGLTDLGGEQTDVTMTMDMYAGDQSTSVTAIGSMIIEPCESGLTGSYSIMEKSPAIGLDRYSVDILFSSTDYAPAALTEVALETATDEELETLEDDVYAACLALGEQITQAIPAETLSLFMEAAEEITQ